MDFANQSSVNETNLEVLESSIPIWFVLGKILLNIIGMLGNSTVVFIYLKKKDFRPSECFILSIAVIDFCFSFISLLLWLVEVAFHVISGTLNSSLYTFVTFYSLYLVFWMSFNRYVAVARPLDYMSRFTAPKVYSILGGGFIFALIYGLTPVWYFNTSSPTTMRIVDGFYYACKVLFMSIDIVFMCVVYTNVTYLEKKRAEKVNKNNFDKQKKSSNNSNPKSSLKRKSDQRNQCSTSYGFQESVANENDTKKGAFRFLFGLNCFFSSCENCKNCCKDENQKLQLWDKNENEDFEGENCNDENDKLSSSLSSPSAANVKGHSSSKTDNKKVGATSEISKQNHHKSEKKQTKKQAKQRKKQHEKQNEKQNEKHQGKQTDKNETENDPGKLSPSCNGHLHTKVIKIRETLPDSEKLRGNSEEELLTSKQPELKSSVPSKKGLEIVENEDDKDIQIGVSNVQIEVNDCNGNSIPIRTLQNG
ncbi:myb-like protein X [Symsagittifera roscoffensis]|uniref:myb-like protein X n=1 Tax=Symsagittifera roscoffensis TaxID=84072 RepID=UPI00307B85EB